MDNRLTLTVKLTPGKDDDLIDWWQSLRKGAGQALVKSILREHIQKIREREELFSQIGQDTMWLRAALSDLPAQIEHLLYRLTAVQNTSPPAIKPTGELSKSSVARREQRIAKAKW